MFDTANTSPTSAFNLLAVAHICCRGWKKHGQIGPLEDSLWKDPICSYERRYRFDAAVRRYVPVVPLPKCGRYGGPD
jgi:hypothetical protein